MLRIRREQMRAFEKYMRARFETEMLTHLRSLFPTRLADTPDDQLRQTIHDRIERAASYDIAIEDDVRRFLEAVVVLGPDLDTNPWAAEILRDETLDSAQKMDRLEDHEAYKLAREPKPTS